MHHAARQGDLDMLEKPAHPTDAPLRTPVFLPEELAALARRAGLADVRGWSAFTFEPDNGMRVGLDTERWERVILESEMRYYENPRFLGATPLMLRAAKGR
jgi:hypothetical protein